LRRYRLKRTTRAPLAIPNITWCCPVYRSAWRRAYGAQLQWMQLNLDPRDLYANGLAEHAGRPVVVVNVCSLASAAQLREDQANKMWAEGKDVLGAWIRVPVLDAEGNLVPVLDGKGNPVPVLDARGNLVLDTEGNPIPKIQLGPKRWAAIQDLQGANPFRQAFKQAVENAMAQNQEAVQQ